MIRLCGSVRERLKFGLNIAKVGFEYDFTGVTALAAHLRTPLISRATRFAFLFIILV